MADTFTRMDESTSSSGWSSVEDRCQPGPRADRILGMLDASDITDGFVTDSPTRCRPPPAERDGAEPEVVRPLCHDIGKAVRAPNHPAIAAEILRPYVSDDVYDMIRTHQTPGQDYYAHFGADPMP